MAHKDHASNDVGVANINGATPYPEVIAEDAGISIDSKIGERHALAPQEASNEDVPICSFDDGVGTTGVKAGGLQLSAETQIITGSAYPSESLPKSIDAPPHKPLEAVPPPKNSIADRVMSQG